jgi:hypothetical protein
MKLFRYIDKLYGFDFLIKETNSLSGNRRFICIKGLNDLSRRYVLSHPNMLKEPGPYMNYNIHPYNSNAFICFSPKNLPCIK